MCERCEPVPLTIPVEGYLRAEGLAMTYVGKDADVAALTVPARLPAAGEAIAIEHGGMLQFVRMLPGQDAEEAARQHVQATGHPSAIGTVVQIGKEEDDVPVSLMRVQSVVYPIYDELSLWEGPPPLVGELARLEPVQKAELNPLDVRDFDRIVASLSSMVRKTSGAIESEMLTDWLKRLKFDWPTATDAQLLSASKSLNSAMRRASVDIWGGIKGKLRTVSQRTASRSRAAEVQQHNLAIEGSMSVRDRAAINRSVATNAHYIRDYYGRVHPGMSTEMRLIAQQGIEDGLGTFEIGRNMKRGLGGKLKGLSDSYYNVVSSAVVHRSRSFSQLGSYRDAGIEKYFYDATLDEITTDTCRFLHQKEMHVDAGLARYAAADRLKDPTDIRDEMPWITQRNITSGEHEGKQALYVPSRDGMQQVAVIEKSGYGKKDDVGRFSNAMSTRELKNAHIGPPPLHAR